MSRQAKPKNLHTGGTAAIYARYSSHNQKDASIEQQIAECMQHAAELGLSVVATYADRAISGKTDRRPQFQKMMRDAEAGKFAYVLAWKSNRIGRNMLQAMMNEERLNQCGVRVMYTEEDFDDTAAGRFALRSMMNVNQFYSENMAEDIRRGLMDNAQQMKVNGPLPYGYKASHDRHYAIDEGPAKIVQEIYRDVAAGKTLSSIIDSLNERGIVNKLGRPFTKNSFSVILKNERYKGIYIYKDIRIEGGIPRIVSDELFNKVQEVLRMKKNPRCSGRRRENGSYLLTGKLFCGHCKSPMVGVSGTSQTGNLHFYYACQKRRKEHSCDKKNVAKEWIEDKVAFAIMDYCLSDEIIELIADKTVEYNQKRLDNSDIPMLESELSEVKAGTKNILKAIEAGIFTDTTKDRLLELESRAALLSSRIEEEKANIIVVSKEDIIAGLQMYRDGDIEDDRFRATLFDTFLIAVYLYDKSLKIVFSFTDNKNTIEVPIENIIDDDQLEIIKEEMGAKVRTQPPKPHHVNKPNLYPNAEQGSVFNLQWLIRTLGCR